MRKINLYLYKQVYNKEETADPKLMGKKTNIVHIKQEAVNLFPLLLFLSVLLHKRAHEHRI